MKYYTIMQQWCFLFFIFLVVEYLILCMKIGVVVVANFSIWVEMLEHRSDSNFSKSLRWREVSRIC